MFSKILVQFKKSIQKKNKYTATWHNHKFPNTKMTFIHISILRWIEWIKTMFNSDENKEKNVFKSSATEIYSEIVVKKCYVFFFLRVNGLKHN